MKIEEKFEHILENSIHIQDPDGTNVIGWFYPNNISELRHKKLCELMDNVYKPNLDNYDLLIEQDIKNDTFWIHYSKIWSVFYDEKGWDASEVQAFTQERLEQHLKRKGVTTGRSGLCGFKMLEQHLKRKGVTTIESTFQYLQLY